MTIAIMPNKDQLNEQNPYVAIQVKMLDVKEATLMDLDACFNLVSCKFLKILRPLDFTSIIRRFKDSQDIALSLLKRIISRLQRENWIFWASFV